MDSSRRLADEEAHLKPLDFELHSIQRSEYERHLKPFRKYYHQPSHGLDWHLGPDQRKAGGRSAPKTPTSDSHKSASSSSRKERILADGTRTLTTKRSISSAKSESDALDAEQIVWHYLTYETEVPSPKYTHVDEEKANDPPTAPDLTPYCNPHDWSPARKSVQIWLSCAATAITAYGAGEYSPGVNQMSVEWNTSSVVTLIGISIFTAGFAIAPMILAPFSELNGRRPIFLITGSLFLVFDICCAVTRTYPGMIVSRFLTGCASSTFSTMVGGLIADLYHASERNTPMAIFTFGALFGTGLGPMISGFLAQNTSWRWIFYCHSIIVAVLVAALFLLFRETRGPVLLSRKAEKLNAWYEAREAAGYHGFDMAVDGSNEKQNQRIRWKVKDDEQRATFKQMIKISTVRPFHLLFTEPVVFFFSLWITFAWAVLYCTFSAIPYMFQTVYNFSLEQSGAVFASIAIASFIAVALCIGQERLAVRWGMLTRGPESRLTFTCVESALLPIGLFWFGWTSSSSIPWIVPALAIGCATIGIFSVYLAVFNYLADTYHRYASSAIAAQSFCRNLIGGCFPLFTQQMFQTLGFGRAGSLLGGIGIALTFVPWVLFFYGSKIRARSKFASDIVAGN